MHAVALGAVGLLYAEIAGRKKVKRELQDYGEYTLVVS